MAKKFRIKSIDRKSGLIREHFVLVDDEDAHLLRSNYWVVANAKDSECCYAQRRVRDGYVFLQHAVLGISGDDRVYHINGNKLDCRKENLLRQSERTEEIPE